MADLIGPVAAVDYVKAILTAEYAAMIAVVTAERGIDPSDMVLTAMRATMKPNEEYTFPFAWVSAVPDGQVIASSETSITTRSRCTAFVADRSPDGEVLAARLQCHLIALMRLFLWRASGDITAHVTDYTGTPPYAPDDTTWVGGVGIEIEVTVPEDID